MNTTDTAAPSDAAITACALMIKGICLTKHRDAWASLIEARIRFMLASQDPLPDTEDGQCAHCGNIAPTAEQAEGVRVGERFVLDEVCDERIRQDKQWGGDKHDDEHGPIEWLGFIDYQADKAISETAGLQTDRSIAPYVRARLVKIAALAVAGMASIDRCFPDASSTGEQA